MSLIAIGWDGHIRGSGAANKMKKKSTHYGHGPSSKILYLFGNGEIVDDLEIFGFAERIFLIRINIFPGNNKIMPSKAKRSHMTMVVHGPHEPVDELLLLGSRVVHHRHRDRCRVVLVLRQTQLVQPSIGT